MSGPYANLLTESPAPGELVSVGTGAEENTRHFVIFALTRATAWTRFSIHFFFFCIDAVDGWRHDALDTRVGRALLR